MATYYKYAERNAANQVDWSAIGKSISDTLSNEVKRREQAKKDIEDASNQYAETLANAPMGESRDFNEWTLDFANNAQEFRLMQDRMLRSGRMKLRDYNMGRQNLKSGTEQAFNLANQYNTEYADKMKRLQNGESQDLEGFLMGTAEGFSNFTESSLYIDPTTGKVAVANKVQKTLPDGTVVYEMSKNPNDFTSINSLRNRITSKYNKFDVSKNLQPGVSDLGKRIEVIMKGGVKTREDAKQTPGYTTARNTFIDSFVETNPDNLTSILTDTLTQVVRDGQATGESFEFTFDPEQAKSSDKYILLRENPQTGRVEGDFTTANGKKQKEMAKEFLKTKFDTMVDVEETARQEFAPPRPTAYDEKSKEQQNIDTQNTTAWGQLYYGTPDEQRQGANRLLASPIARREDLIDIDVRTEPGTVILRYKDSTKNRKIDIIDDAGNPISYADFMSLGNELHGVEDYGKALRLSGRSEAAYNIDRKGRATRAGKANLYSDPETLVTYGGERNKTPKSIIEGIPSEIDENAVKTVSDVFSLLNLPKPTITTKEGGQDIPKEPTMADYSGLTFAEKTKPSLEIVFPGAPTINIPEGEDFQDTLSKVMEVLDSSFKTNVDISIEEIKAAFPTLEMFELYNPGFTTEATTGATKKRSIAQIMKEDGVTQAEAVKIFKAQ